MARTNDSKMAVAYTRVSTSTQALGLEAQRAAITSWAAREGVTVVAWFEDRVSGTSSLEDRPGLLAALAAVRAHGAGVLLLQKRDRLARDAVEAGLIERAVRKLGAEVRTADASNAAPSATTVLVNGILDNVAAFEGAQIRARIKAALAEKRRRGEKLGGRAPYGQRVASDGVRLEADADEQAVIAAARDLAATGLSQRAIATELAARGLVGRTGAPLGQSQISRFLAA